MADESGEKADAGPGVESDDQLTPADAEVVRHARVGTACNLMARPPNQRLVSSSVLYELCVGDRWQVHPKGIRLVGASFEAALDFEYAELRAPLMLMSCEASGGLLLSFAKVSSLVLSACELSFVELPGATVEGQLILTGCKLKGTNDGYSLTADKMRLSGDAFLDDGFEAAGAVLLTGATIEGQLNMTGAKLKGTNDDGYSLSADLMRVCGGMFLSGGFEAAGAVRLGGATIESWLSMTGAKVKGKDSDGDSLAAHGLRLSGDAFLDDGFEAAGAVLLAGATIEGQLSMTGAKLKGTTTKDSR